MKWRTTPPLIGSARRWMPLLRSERGGSEDWMKRRVGVLMRDERRLFNPPPPPFWAGWSVGQWPERSRALWEAGLLFNMKAARRKQAHVARRGCYLCEDRECLDGKTTTNLDVFGKNFGRNGASISAPFENIREYFVILSISLFEGWDVALGEHKYFTSTGAQMCSAATINQLVDWKKFNQHIFW